MKRFVIIALAAVGVLLTSNANALYWSEVEFVTQGPDWQFDAVKQYYSERIERAQRRHPGQSVEILLGKESPLWIRLRVPYEWNSNLIYAYLRGDQEFCTKNGCLLALLKKDKQGNWESTLELNSNGYLIVTDLMVIDRPLLIVETNARCINLAWNGDAYDRHPNPGPYNIRKDIIICDMLYGTEDDFRDVLRRERISYSGVSTEGQSVAVSVKSDADISRARDLLERIAEKRDGQLKSEGRTFRITYDFEGVPDYFVLK